MADLARDMTAAGFPITRTAIDNTRRQEPRLAAFSSLTGTDVGFLGWALDRWPDADFLPLALAGSPAAEIIVGEQEEANRRRTEGIAGEMSGEAPAPSNTSQERPPYRAKDALRAIAQRGSAPSANGLNNHDNSNASLGLPKPIEGSQVRTMGIVRSKGNGAAPIHDPNQEQFEAEEGPSGSAGKSPVRPFTPIAED